MYGFLDLAGRRDASGCSQSLTRLRVMREDFLDKLVASRLIRGFFLSFSLALESLSLLGLTLLTQLLNLRASLRRRDHYQVVFINS